MRKVSESNDWESWCKFFLIATENQAIRNLEIAESIQKLYDKMKEVFSEILASKWSVNTLDFVFTTPVFRNNKFTSNSGIPAPTAAKFTKRLVEQGLLMTKEPAAGRRPARYSFEPLMELVRV